MAFLSQISLPLKHFKVGTKTHRGALKSIGALAGGNLTGAVLGAVGGILVARFIGPEVNGQFRLFTIPLMYLTFLHMGTFDGLYRQIPFFFGKGRTEEAARLASAAGAWNLYVSLFVGTGFTLCALWGVLQGDFIAAAGWFSQGLTCLAVYYGGYLCATYRTLDNFVVLARIQLIQAVAAFCLVAAVAFWGFYGLCLRAAIPGLLTVWLYHRHRPLRNPLTLRGGALKGVIKIGLPLCIWGTIYTSLWMATEYSLMMYFGGVKAVGLFSIALIMRESMVMLPQAVYQVLLPKTVESFAREDSVCNAATRNIKLAGMTVLIMLVLVLLIAFFLDYFVPAFIPKYIDGLLLMKICLAWPIIYAASLPLGGLVATGRSWNVGKGILAGMLLFPLAAYLLDPVIGGMLAVAVGSLVGRLVRTVVAYCDLFGLMRREAK